MQVINTRNSCVQWALYEAREYEVVLIYTQYSGLVLLSGQTFTLSLLATSTLEVVPFCTYTLVPVILPFFKNMSWKLCSMVSSTACVSVWTWTMPNQQYFNLIFIWGTEKSCRGQVRGGGQEGDSYVALVKKSIVDKVWDVALLWCNSQFFVIKFWALFHTFFLQQQNVMVEGGIDWSAGTNSLSTIPSMSKKMMNLLFMCLISFFGLWLFHW